MANKITVTLPRAEAIFPKLNEIDVYQPMRNGKPNGAEKRRFLTKLKFSDDDKRRLDKYFRKTLDDAGFKEAKLPWKKISKKDETPVLEVTSGEDYPPPFVDAKGNEVPRSKIKIGGGSILKVGVTVNVYDGFGGGLNFYINFIQIIELKKSARTIEVEKEEGFTWDGSNDEDEDNQFDTSAPEAPDTTEDDDIPF